MDLLATVGQCDNGYACVYQNNLFLVLTDDSAPGRGPSSDRLRAVVRRRWEPRRSSRALQETGQPARFGHRGNGSLEESTWTERSSQGQPVFGDGPRGRAADSEGRDRRGGQQLPDLDRPVGVPASYAEHARLMFDLQVLALQGMSLGLSPSSLPVKPAPGPTLRSAFPTRITRSRITATIPRRLPRWPRSTSSTCRCLRNSSRS